MVIREHIFLVGMAGCGKTSLGRRVAKNLGKQFLDTDQYISEAMNMTVNEIYESVGEDFFRNAETAALVDLSGREPCIISTGEGTVLNEENVAIMRNNGVIIFVDRPLDQILSDIKMDRRPTLKGGTHEDVIVQYNQRIGYYKSAADFKFDNSKGFYVGLNQLTLLIQSLYSLADYT